MAEATEGKKIDQVHALATLLYIGLKVCEAFWNRAAVPLGRVTKRAGQRALWKFGLAVPTIVEAIPGALRLFHELTTFIVVGVVQTAFFCAYLLVVVFMALAGGYSLLVHMNASLQLPLAVASGHPEWLIVNPLDPLISVVLLLIAAVAFFRATKVVEFKSRYLYWTPPTKR